MINVNLPKIVGKSYNVFWKTRKRYRCVKGGRASKKSCTTALYYIYNMMKFYNVYGLKPCLLVIRRYENTHRNSTRSQLIWAIRRLGVEKDWNIPKGDYTLTYRKSGQQILFKGMDKPDSITSITVSDGYLCFCWIEEAYQLHDEAAFDKLDMSFRGDVPYPLFKQLTLTFNPWSDTTWIKARFFDKPDEDTFILTTDYTCNEFLGDDDRAIFEKMKTNSPRRYAIEGLGNWGIAQGLIYGTFTDDPYQFYIPDIPADEKIALITIGLDYGSGEIGDGTKKGKTVLQATAITMGFSKIYAIDEDYFKADYDADEVADWVIVFLKKLKERYKTDIILHAEWAGSMALNNQIRKKIREKGLFNVKIYNCYKGLINDRIDLEQILLSEKRIFFTDKVPGLKAAYSTALWDVEKQKKEGKPIRLDNGTTDICSLDAHEYSINSYANYLMAYTPKEPKTYKHGLQVINN
jgi:PBSX family phage terminase large subunit